MNIFWQELKYYRRSTVIWIITLCAVTMVFLSIYTSLASQIDSFRDIVSHYPKALLEAINFRFEIFYSIYGYLSYIMTLIWLAGAIQAMNLGLGVVSKEVSGKTADFLLSKPVSRNKMIAQKFAAVLILIVITNLVFTLSAAMGAKLFSPSSFDMKLFLLVSFSLFFVQLFFLAVGFVAGVVLPKVKTVVSVTLPVVFALFIVASFGAIVDRPEVYYITPFKYFDATYIFQHGYYEPKYMLILASVVIVSLVISFVVYNRKDIPQL